MVEFPLSRHHRASRPGFPGYTFVLGLLIAVTTMSLGCEPSPSARRQLRFRTDRLQRTAGMLSRSEQSRPDRLRHDAEFISTDLKRQAAAFERDTREAERLGQRDLQRFHDRQRLYRDTTGRILWGKPQQIEPEVPILFF